MACVYNNSCIFLMLTGTCVNNTSVMMFKKGGFEVTPVVYPVAIKVGKQYNRPVLKKLHKINILLHRIKTSDSFFLG